MKRPTFEELWKKLHENGSVSFVNCYYSATMSGWCGVEFENGQYYHNTDWNIIPIAKEEAEKILRGAVEDPSTVF